MENKKEKKQRNKYAHPILKRNLWYVANFFLIILPFAILCIVEKDYFFATTNKNVTSINNVVGLVLLALFLLIMLSKYAHILKGFWGVLILTAISFFLKEVANDLCVICVVCCVSSLLSTICNWRIKYWNKIYNITLDADIHAQANEKVVDKVINQGVTNGRV